VGERRRYTAVCTGVGGTVGRWLGRSNKVDYKAVAAKMREQNPEPALSMFIPEYHTASVIYAVIRAMEAMEESK
jgi:hypothetical protein